MENERDSPKVNVRCALSRDCLIAPFCFEEKTIDIFIYLDMLDIVAIPQIESQNIVFQQDEAPLHFSSFVLDFLNERFPQRWIGQGGWKAGPHTHLTLMPLISFCGDLLKHRFKEKIFVISNKYNII